MKLDPKCTFAVLAAIEEAVSCQGSFVYIAGDRKPKELEPYSDEEIAYHVHQCDLSGYLIGCSITGNGGMVMVEDLDPKGHEALAASRENSAKAALKKILSEVGNDAGKRGVMGLLQWLLVKIKTLFG